MNIGGKQVKGTTLALAGGGLAVAFLFYRHYASGSSSGSSSSSAIDPVTGLPTSMDNQVDPATGMTYLAEAQQYGSVSAAEAATAGNYSAAGGYSGLGYVGTAGYPSTSNVGPSTAPQGYATNAAWAQAVQAGLSGLGYTPTDIAAALGLFFAQHPLPPNYASIVQAAEAEYGPPPQGTYAIIPEPSSGGGAGGGGPTGSADVTVPNVIGRWWHPAQQDLRAAGLQVRTQQNGNPAKPEFVRHQSPAAGQKVPHGSVVVIDVTN